MSDSEKWAWWTLGVVALTIAAYGAFLAFLGHGPATSSVFALLALSRPVSPFSALPADAISKAAALMNESARLPTRRSGQVSVRHGWRSSA